VPAIDQVLIVIDTVPSCQSNVKLHRHVSVNLTLLAVQIVPNAAGSVSCVKIRHTIKPSVRCCNEYTMPLVDHKVLVDHH
jgi:hypothetical protein